MEIFKRKGTYELAPVEPKVVARRETPPRRFRRAFALAQAKEAVKKLGLPRNARRRQMHKLRATLLQVVKGP